MKKKLYNIEFKFYSFLFYHFILLKYLVQLKGVELDDSRVKGNKSILAVFRLLRHLVEKLIIRHLISKIKILFDYFSYLGPPEK